MLGRLSKFRQAKRCAFSSVPGNGLKVKKALLLPSKIPIFPFQSHVSVISDDDRDTLRKLSFQHAVMSLENKYLEPIPEDTMEIIKQSEKEAVKLVSQSVTEDPEIPEGV